MSMHRYRNAVVVLKANGLYSGQVAIALRAEYRRQLLVTAQKDIDSVENIDTVDNTSAAQQGEEVY